MVPAACFGLPCNRQMEDSENEEEEEEEEGSDSESGSDAEPGSDAGKWPHHLGGRCPAGSVGERLGRC